MAEGASGIAVLVGGSSTGKTRACWEALGLLRDQGPPWRLWHPIDPSRPDAALRELPAIGPRTVVWLNEAQFYLEVTAGRLGERVAAGLRELLRERDRGPVLVLATLWPEFGSGPYFEIGARSRMSRTKPMWRIHRASTDCGSRPAAPGTRPAAQAARQVARP